MNLDFNFPPQFFLSQHPSLISCRSSPKEWTPIHYAARQLNWEMVELLLEFGADVNVTTHKGSFFIFFYFFIFLFL